jgi:uncharacterized membrane protein YeaQ/YmgE (transglycosylase-associated protein family)
MHVYALVAFTLIGAVAGWVGGMLLKHRSLGPIGNIVPGVIGACIGGVLASVPGLAAPGVMGSAMIKSALSFRLHRHCGVVPNALGSSSMRSYPATHLEKPRS